MVGFSENCDYMFIFGSFPDNLSVVVLHESEVNQARVTRQSGTVTVVVNCQAAKYSMVIPIRPSDIYFERRMHDLEKFLKQEVFSGYTPKSGSFISFSGKSQKVRYFDI